MAKRREHTFTVSVSAPSGLTRAQVRREVRELIRDGNVWGVGYPTGRGTHMDPDYAEVEIGTIKPKRIT